jgi:hypothetical protein
MVQTPDISMAFRRDTRRTDAIRTIVTFLAAGLTRIVLIHVGFASFAVTRPPNIPWRTLAYCISFSTTTLGLYFVRATDSATGALASVEVESLVTGAARWCVIL